MARGGGPYKRQLSDGSYSYWVKWDEGIDPATGERIVRTKQNRNWNYEDAERFLLNKVQEVNQGLVPRSGKLTVGEYPERWLTDYVRDLDVTTQSSYAFQVRRHIVPRLGRLRLDEIRPLDVQSFLTRQRDRGRLDGRGGLSPRTVRYQYRLLSMALDRAVKLQLIPRNPAEPVDPPRQKRQRPPRTWKIEHIQAFFGGIDDDRHWAFYWLAMTTGLRQSELIGLTWDGVDLEERRVTVTEQITRTQDNTPVRKDVKSASSRRWVKISTADVRAFEWQRRRQAEERLQAGPAWPDTDLVFTRPDGRHLSHNAVLKHFQLLARNLELPVITIHDLRHTHLTLLVEQGEPLSAIQQRAGHANIQTTMQYLHPGDLQEDAAETLSRRLKKNSR